MFALVACVIIIVIMITHITIIHVRTVGAGINNISLIDVVSYIVVNSVKTAIVIIIVVVKSIIGGGGIGIIISSSVIVDRAVKIASVITIINVMIRCIIITISGDNTISIGSIIIVSIVITIISIIGSILIVISIISISISVVGVSAIMKRQVVE